MITEIKGDLLSVDADIICHQTNFYGVMGGGIALAIKNHVLPQKDFGTYQRLCHRCGASLLGKVLYLSGVNKNKKPCVVANLFCQGGPLRSGFVLTHYGDMRTCLQKVEKDARLSSEKFDRPVKVALPGNMGCGIAGGDWAQVRQIIEDVFGRSPVPLTIVHLDQRWMKG